MNEAQRKAILQDAINQLSNNKGILKDSPIIQKFVDRRNKIDKVAAKKNPLVKEYIDIHKEAEKNPNSTIGRMTKAMKNIAAQHMIYATAMEMSSDEQEKQDFKRVMDELENHPTVVAYEKYVEGLSYLSGEINEVSPEVKDFFQNELAVPLQEHNSEYERYRVGVETYIKQETERLKKLEAEFKLRLPELEKEQQELDEKERSEGTMHPELLKALNEEITIKKEREALEREKGSPDYAKKSNALSQKAGMNFLKLSRFTQKYGSLERQQIMNEKKELEDKIKSIPDKIIKLNEQRSPEEQEKQDEYQKAVAKMKARELYEKKALGFEALTKNFVGDYLKNEERVKGSPFTDRQTPSTICVSMMLRRGYKLEDIMNPTALLDKKKEIGQEYIKHRQANDVEWYLKTMYDGADALMNAYEEYVKEHKDELKTEQDLAMHAGTLGAISMLCFDMFQELKHGKSFDNGKFYKTAEQYSDMQGKLSGYEIAADLASPVTVKYDLDKLDVSTVSIESNRQVCVKMFLEEIQKENPNFNSVLLDLPKQQNVETQLVSLPEFKKIYGNDSNIDVDNLSKEDAKQLAFLQSIDFVKKNNIRFDLAKHPTTVTVKPKAAGNHIEKGQKLECVVSYKGKQLVATDIPVRVDDCFKNIESKDIRGKRKDNSDQFNIMMDEYDKALGNIGYEKTDAENLDGLKNLKEAAVAYLNAKRAQKGYKTDKLLDFKVDMQMLGREKGGKSIFTTKGKEKYEFALQIVTNIENLEQKYGKAEMQKQDVEKTQLETGDKEFKEMEKESSEFEGFEK